MSVIALPTGLMIAECSISQARYDMAEMSDASGHAAARLFGPPRWRVSLRSHASLSLALSAQWEAMLLQLRGGVNHLSVYDPVRTAPQGTYRGTVTLSGSHSAGATSLALTGGSGTQTLLAGDWLQVGTGVGTSQLVKVMANATASGGAITVTVEPPLRTAFSNGTAVTWNKPLAYYKQTSEPAWSYAAARTSGGYAVDLLESWG